MLRSGRGQLRLEFTLRLLLDRWPRDHCARRPLREWPIFWVHLLCQLTHLRVLHRWPDGIRLLRPLVRCGHLSCLTVLVLRLGRLKALGGHSLDGVDMELRCRLLVLIFNVFRPPEDSAGQRRRLSWDNRMVIRRWGLRCRWDWFIRF